MSEHVTEAGPLATAYQRALSTLTRTEFVDQLWSRRPSAWSQDEATQASIANRLGWLGALDFITPELPRLDAVARAVREDGFTDVVLIGMGGSSLAPEVFRQVVGVSPGWPTFRMLDSVNPAAVRSTMARAATTLFVVASKSGSTIEPSVMSAEARRCLIEVGHVRWGQRVIAITDAGSALHQQAEREGFREVFLNPPDIGGRYSALSYFGLVPAALMGIDLDALVDGARHMEHECRDVDPARNPGLALGALMATGAQSGRDKLTLLFPTRLQALALWIEQLVAESTGKNGQGVVPIAGEDVAVRLGSDRVLVRVGLGTAASPAAPPPLHGDGAPTASWMVERAEDLGAEFLRWQVATAAASALLGVNPFDEPNVRQAKDATQRLLRRYADDGRLPEPPVHIARQNVVITLSAAAQNALGADARVSLRALVTPGDYVGLLAYVSPEDEPARAVLERARLQMGTSTGAATMFGYGPRYLHSTGQLHKGGADNGVFVIVTVESVDDLSIPGEAFTFGVLERAQGLGDFESLDGMGRRTILVSVRSHDTAALAAVLDEVAS